MNSKVTGEGDAEEDEVKKLQFSAIKRGHSNMHAGIVLGLLTTVLVLDPPKLVCRALFGSYPHG